MSRADWQFAVGVLLALIFGIPSIPLFAKGNTALGVLTLLLAIIILGLTVYFSSLLRLPPYTVLEHHSHIEVLDASGREARVRKTIVLRPNHRGQKYFTHRDISSDGTDITFTVDPAVAIVKQSKSAGDYHVTIEFPHLLRRMRAAPATWLEMTCTGAFTKNLESVTLQVDQPLKRATIEIVLPHQRPPNLDSVKLVYRYSGNEEEQAKPEVNGNRIRWERRAKWFRSLRFGEYEISWRW